ncbi:MAG: DUF2325 domain-containing protein [Thiotrichaceae bacterium]|nr:DUF2325 domain-containing protein [Thiotrichaceae bacterium]
MVILVGADRLGNIENLLKDRGLEQYRHITGRDPKLQKFARTSMSGVNLMILFTDFVGHNVMRNFRKLARENKVPFIACKRTMGHVATCLDKCGYAEPQSCEKCQQCDMKRK